MRATFVKIIQKRISLYSIGRLTVRCYLQPEKDGVTRQIFTSSGSAIFCDFTQRRMAVSYGRFGSRLSVPFPRIESA